MITALDAETMRNYSLVLLMSPLPQQPATAATNTDVGTV